VNGIWTSELRAYAGTESGAAVGLWDRVRQLAPAAGVGLLPERWRIPGGLLVDSTTSGGATGVGFGEVGTALPVYGEPFAVVVVNAKEGIGYVDLYNLPLLPAGQEFHVWLQNETGGAFTSVGPVPGELAGGSAGLVFRVPQGAEDARRVVITLEPFGGAGHPSGPIVIRGS